MNPLLLMFASSALLFLGSASPVQAIDVAGPGVPTAVNVPPSSVVQRGGTVNSIDTAGKSMVVDGVSYQFPVAAIMVHGQGAKGAPTTIASLRPGMQIRFSTSRHNFSSKEQVQEIWVAGPNPQPAKK